MADEYRIEGNITGISYQAERSAKVSITFVPEQNYTITIDGRKWAVFVCVDTQTARQIEYEKELTIEIFASIHLNLSLGKGKLIFAEKSDDAKQGVVEIKSDLEKQLISDWQIVEYGIRQ